VQGPEPFSEDKVMATIITSNLASSGTTTVNLFEDFLVGFTRDCELILTDFVATLLPELLDETSRQMCHDKLCSVYRLDRYEFSEQAEIVNKAVNKALRRSMRRKEKKTDLVARFYLVESRRCWIGVMCDACNGPGRRQKLIGGCMLCYRWHDELRWLLADMSFMAGLKTVRENCKIQVPKLVLADWLDERGYCELAELFRKSAVKS